MPVFESDILFAGNDVEDQYWRRELMPKFKSIRERENHWQREYERCWVTGAWMANKGEAVYLPPNYYFFLRYWRINRAYPEFRMKRLKNQLFKLHVRQNPGLIGSYTIKNRRDGETISAMSDLIWEALPCEQGLFGIQSKTGDDAKDVCWRQLMIGFKGLPRKMKVDESGPIWDGSTDPKKVLALKKASGYVNKDNYIIDEDDDMGDEDSETLIYWRATTSNAFDGREMRKIVIDEFNKWEEDSALDAYTTYIDCILQGNNRRGLMDIFSSPSETAGRHNDEALTFWKMCDPNNVDPDTGLVKSRIPRYFSNPLDGIESFYDKYGNADPDKIYNWIMKRRAAMPADKLNNEIRKFPLNETEAFETFDNAATWAALKQIQDRKIYVFGRAKKEDGSPKYLQCKIGWEDGWPDTTPEITIVSDEPVYNPKEYKSMKAPWLISENYFDRLPPLSILTKPPKISIIDSILGVDPYDYRRPKTKSPSLGAGVNYKFNDMMFTGINKSIPMIYLDRPAEPNIFYEQMLLGALISQSMIQTENKNRNFIDYVEDRGYFNWLLPSDLKKNHQDKGNSPGGNTPFMDDVSGLLDSLLSNPEFLNSIWYDVLLHDIIHFNRMDTHENDLTMALLQAIFGAYKIIMHNRKRKPMSNEFAEALSDFL